MTIILITGANRGIGLELARQYAKDGATVIATAREPAKAKTLNDIAASSGGKLRVLPLDVSDAQSIAKLKKTLADQPIDILINNAGISGPKVQDAGHIDPDGFLETFRVNSVAPMLVAQAFHDNLKRGHDKKLVTITSMMGSTSGHFGGMYAYRASKAAVNNLMHGLSKEWAKDGISVGILHPGWVRTDMGGANAAVAVEDSAKGLRQRIAELSKANSGTYRDYANQELAW
jgi:NAD(P)-dependent dehydrogenase (short-subunit alcohol dehydrogenase family)